MYDSKQAEQAIAMMAQELGIETEDYEISEGE